MAFTESDQETLLIITPWSEVVCPPTGKEITMLLTLVLLLLIGAYLLLSLRISYATRLIDRPASRETLEGTGPADLS